MPEPEIVIFEFGPYRLDRVKRVLLREGAPVPLTPKALETLLALIENRGQILGKEELISRVWPDTTVEDGNLTVNISMLRKALGESPNEHRYIVTVPGRGYRFVADVRETQDHGTALVIEERTRSSITIEKIQGDISPQAKQLGDGRLQFAIAEPPQFALGRRVGLKLLIQTTILLVLVAIAGLLWNHFGRRREKDWREDLHVIRIVGTRADRKESINSARFSPDATLMAYSAAGPTNGLNLWIKQVGGGQPFPITDGPSYDQSPIWSPDGLQIAFISTRDNQIGIWTVPSLGRQEPTMLKTLEPDSSHAKGDTTLMQWSSKRPVIYYCWENNVYELNVSSRESTQLTTFDPSTPFDMDLRISPDEQSISYVVQEDGGRSHIWWRPLKDDHGIQITHDDGIDGMPVWHPDGKRIIYSSNQKGRFRLCIAYLDGRPEEVITLAEGEGYVWDISGDGTKLLYYGRRDESELYKVDLVTGEEAPFGSDMALNFWPQISPDGGQIAFQKSSSESASWNPHNSSLRVWSEASPDGARLLAPDAFAGRWSPDGKHIAFLRRSQSSDDLYVIASTGGAEKPLATGVLFGGSYTQGPPYNPCHLNDVSWSPDSATLAVCSETNSISNLRIFPIDGSPPTQVSANSDPNAKLECPVWSPDGKRIAYVTKSGGQDAGSKESWMLWATDFHSGARSIYQTGAILRLLGWSGSDDTLLIAEVKNSDYNGAFPADSTISQVVIQNHTKRELRLFESTYFSNIQLSPDGRNVSLVSAYKGRDDIWLLPVGGTARRITANKDSKTYYSGLAWSPDGKSIYCAKQSTLSIFNIYQNFR
jgi:Tol biopolymer transport system component/DNA-binding winged helix-turn-helix (wHTH) protein